MNEAHYDFFSNRFSDADLKNADLNSWLFSPNLDVSLVGIGQKYRSMKSASWKMGDICLHSKFWKKGEDIAELSLKNCWKVKYAVTSSMEWS